MIVFIRWVSINFGKLQSCCNSSQKLNKRVSFLLQELMTLFLIFAFITIVSIPTNYLWENWWKEEEAEARLDMRFDQKSAHCSCQNDNDFSTEVVNTWKGSINIIECYFFFPFIVVEGVLCHNLSNCSGVFQLDEGFSIGTPELAGLSSCYCFNIWTCEES